MATETDPKPLALYHRNGWHNMTEIPGTTATELSSALLAGLALHYGAKNPLEKDD